MTSSKAKLITLLMGLLAALLVAACGGGDDIKPNVSATTNATSSSAATQQPGGNGESASAAPVDTSGSGGNTSGSTACDLITNDEVDAAMGQDMKDGVEQDIASPFYSCNWDSDGPLSLTVTLYQGQFADTYYGLTTGAESVDGVGDKAQWNGDIGNFEVLKGDSDLTIDVIDYGASAADQNLAIAKALAEKALDRLP